LWEALDIAKIRRKPQYFSAARSTPKEKMFQPCALGISHDEQKINPRIIILH
jgi:hypothetical protein